MKSALTAALWIATATFGGAPVRPAAATPTRPSTETPTKPQTKSSTKDGCQASVCELGGDASRCPSGTACDPSRNRCVPVCTGEACCLKVTCPAGTVCVPGDGRCGWAAGNGCFDLARTSADKRPAAPVFITVINRTSSALAFTAGLHTAVQFKIRTSWCGRERALALPENSFCPVLCPAEGPPQEVDCRKPAPRVSQLGAGESVRVLWSGEEELERLRICRSSSTPCRQRRTAAPGRYQLEVCAQDTSTGPDQPRCARVSFVYPASEPIVVVFR